MGGARFLRTIRARHRNGVVVVKVCGKNNSNVSFKHYAKLLKAQRQALKDVPNVLAYQKIRETPTIGVLVRQFIHNSLYDRVSIRPFLENIEKKWIAFQLLCAVRDCHARGIFHGDIKSENVLVTSWGWVFLTDFASAFKPVYLPEDNPAEFSFYYDTSARRTCYLAPERLLAAGENPRKENVVEWNMDIFSLGCVLAELFTETPTFTLSQLFRYRKREYDPTLALLNKVDDDNVRSLISSMIRLIYTHYCKKSLIQHLAAKPLLWTTAIMASQMTASIEFTMTSKCSPYHLDMRIRSTHGLLLESLALYVDYSRCKSIFPTIGILRVPISAATTAPSSC